MSFTVEAQPKTRDQGGLWGSEGKTTAGGDFQRVVDDVQWRGEMSEGREMRETISRERKEKEMRGSEK